MKAAQFIFSALLIAGCSNNQILQPEQLRNHPDADIAVYTVDNRRIHFFKGDYEVVQRGDSSYIRGKGTLHSEGTKILSKPFQGELQLTSIKHVEILDRNPLKGVLGLGALLLALLALSLLIMLLSGGPSINIPLGR